MEEIISTSTDKIIMNFRVTAFKTIKVGRMEQINVQFALLSSEITVCFVTESN